MDRHVAQHADRQEIVRVIAAEGGLHQLHAQRLHLTDQIEHCCSMPYGKQAFPLFLPE